MKWLRYPDKILSSPRVRAHFDHKSTISSSFFLWPPSPHIWISVADPSRNTFLLLYHSNGIHVNKNDFKGYNIDWLFCIKGKSMKRNRRIIMQSSYLHSKHPNILSSLDELFHLGRSLKNPSSCYRSPSVGDDVSESDSQSPWHFSLGYPWTEGKSILSIPFNFAGRY